VLKTIAMTGLVLGALGFGMNVNTAQAFVSSPNAANIAGGVLGPTEVRWVCGPNRCAWREGAGPIHPWAVGWGAPRLPGCYWAKKRNRWIEVCG
jgi:hypothetical protein